VAVVYTVAFALFARFIYRHSLVIHVEPRRWYNWAPLPLLATAALVALVLVRRRNLRDWLLSIQIDGSNVNILRAAFNRETVMPTRLQAPHTHGESARDRSTSRALALQYAASVGLVPYVRGLSRRDVYDKLDGDREYYWAKDLIVTSRSTSKKHNHIDVYVDDDYYYDMPTELVNRCSPAVVCTVVPDAAARGHGEYSYSFDAKGNLHYNVSGGGSYVHGLWNYGHDNLVVNQRPWWAFGLITRTVYYTVDRKSVGPDHQVILLVPVVVLGLFSSLVSRDIFGQELLRFNPVTPDGRFVRFERQTSAGRMTTIGVPNQYANATIQTTRLDNLIACELAGSKLTSSHCSVWCELRSDQTKADDDIIRAMKLSDGAVVLHYIHSVATRRAGPIVYPVSSAVINYEMVGKASEITMNPRPSMQAFMSPIADGGYAGVLTTANAANTARTRCTDLLNDIVLTHQDHLYIKDFFEDVAKTGKLTPVEPSVVAERIGGAKGARLQIAADIPSMERMPTSFLKREAHADPKDMRLISTMTDDVMVAWSCFILPIMDAYKQFPWYGPGKTPVQIAERIAMVAETRSNKGTLMGDFSRLDARQNQLLRALLQGALRQAYSGPDLKRALELLDRHYDHVRLLLSAKTEAPVRYNAKKSLLSGAKHTSVGGTMVDGYIFYVAKRRELLRVNKPLAEQRRLAAEWMRLWAIFFGDDDVVSHIDKEDVDNVCKRYNQVIKFKVCPPTGNIDFLSRYYQPHAGLSQAPHSMTAIRRAFTKIHLVGTVKHADPLNHLHEKMLGIGVNDAATPVLGDLWVAYVLLLDVHGDCKCSCDYSSQLSVVRGIVDRVADITDETSVAYSARCESSSGYPQPHVDYVVDSIGRHSDWMMALLAVDFEEFQYEAYCQHLRNLVRTKACVSSLLVLPMFSQRPLSVEKVAINDDINPGGLITLDPKSTSAVVTAKAQKNANGGADRTAAKQNSNARGEQKGKNVWQTRSNGGNAKRDNVKQKSGGRGGADRTKQQQH
jgi:hypothetical protein